MKKTQFLQYILIFLTNTIICSSLASNILSRNIQMKQMNIKLHKEWVHQYIVQEAYRLLEDEVGEIPLLKNYVGLSHFGPGDNSANWEEDNAISVGVWQEDINNCQIYRNNGNFLHFFNSKPCVSVDHFWDADNGFNETPYLNFLTWATCGSIDYNAYIKAMRYFGGTDYNSNYEFNRYGNYYLSDYGEFVSAMYYSLQEMCR